MKSLDLHRWLACLRSPELRSLFNIPTHLTSRERATLRRLATEREVATGRCINIVEIGSYLGASSAFMASGLAQPGSRVYCIDTWTNDAMTEGRRETQAQFKSNTQRYSELIVPVRGWSHSPDVLGRIQREAGKIDLLFIDGDHSYEGVKADWINYQPLLANNATVVLHDVGWAEGVQRIVAELAGPEVDSPKSLPNLWWGTVK